MNIQLITIILKTYSTSKKMKVKLKLKVNGEEYSIQVLDNYDTKEQSLIFPSYIVRKLSYNTLDKIFYIINLEKLEKKIKKHFVNLDIQINVFDKIHLTIDGDVSEQVLNFIRETLVQFVKNAVSVIMMNHPLYWAKDVMIDEIM